jgi:hypothetical protein
VRPVIVVHEIFAAGSTLLRRRVRRTISQHRAIEECGIRGAHLFFAVVDVISAFLDVKQTCSRPSAGGGGGCGELMRVEGWERRMQMG